MASVLYVYKPVGITPLDLIGLVRKSNPKLVNAKIGYAGRLDPMAKGIVLLLVNEANKERKEYEKLQKTYETETIFGVQTDTYDILGKITAYRNGPFIKEKIDKEIETRYPALIGTYDQPYPPYSSVRINGKPLFYWARHNKLEHIAVPSKKITIFNFKLILSRLVHASDLFTIIQSRIESVKGDFRQTEILEGWKLFFKTNANTTFIIHRYQIICSGGTYIRSLVNSLGKESGYYATAYDITRTHIGTVSLNESIIV